ncbi:Sec-independent protein translocase protein TatB [Sulfitobacter pontiacus]|jgi:sec-independent protein translocase protein TatB|uniref:Sec-independent protein translocase protein TatB n=1 Tax=Sulfitobacter pontiacus TaxID=60137 RepID=UPI000C655E33|nr:Sec-independent protein translocase protein TatB [Sulfitobacter pontiacus]MAN10599.1 twin-arginine translocase subunit TatB [Roseobacter sp.]HCJ00556.1 twin-arginine translocase subunit TatB [Sulfitobacter sp.]HJO52449.1 Sec-independent protein translocase protein TatB [Sulfitobacter pontiacus]|tara:strand:+ start:1148 stop:1756 length:609 start_codon:yes stop_codon:yes gene_type:complete
MFDMGWSELLVVGVVALIVVGPKDLPVLFRKVGQFVGKAKGMAREFSNAMNDAADDTGMREMSSSLNKTLKTATNPLGSAMDEVKSATKSLSKFDPDSETGKLASQRAEDVKKIQAATARAGAERKQREAAEALAQADAAEAKLATPAAAPQIEKPAAKAPAKKAPAKATSAKKPAAKKPAAAKPAAKKAAPKAPAAKKSDT